MYEVKSPENLVSELDPPAPSYQIKPQDRLSIDIFTGKGERLIDPDRILIENRQQVREREDPAYLVQPDGSVDLPMVGVVQLSGLTLFEASKILEKEYAQYYKDPFVLINFINKRVVVLGAVGGQVLNLENDQVRISEVLAMAGGLENRSSAYNIRLIRNENVKLIDLSTVEAFQKNNVVVEPGDIIYVEPIRRPVNEFLRENYSIFGIFSSVISLVAVIISLNN
ncbi:MAG: polysaccharide biosynthesis/export family protein [Candidatus Cyclobacteriaceae bacterium M2_1C_046]